MRRYAIAVIPGDGIGREVISSGLEILDAIAKHLKTIQFQAETFDWGSEYYKQHGLMMPNSALATLKKFDSIYFGAVGDREVPDHVTLWGLRIAICQGLDQYANVRPIKLLPGIASRLRGVDRDHLDWVIVRENSEGEYSGHGGRTHRGRPAEIGTEVAIFTRAGITRIMEYAFELARTRSKKHLTVVTKSNAQRYGMVLWDEIAKEVSHDFPDVTWERILVDAATVKMTLKPEALDTIVATNLHADILSDLAGALAGSLGIAASANIDPTRRSPSMFEPIHGSAFDIIGTGQANPIAAFWSAAMMLDHLGESDASGLLMGAIERVTGAGILTPDLGGKATTREITEAVRGAISEI